jgi:putative sigma-54 modulation protein
MRLELTGRQIDITAGLRRVVETKLAKLERMLNDAAVSVQVVVSREKTGHRAEVTLHARGEKFLHGNGRGEGVATAMTQAVEKIGQQARKVKGKYEGRKRRSLKGADETAAATPASAAPPAPPARRRVRGPRVVRAPRQAIRAMSVSEASALVEGGSDLVIFRHVGSSQIAVVYRALGGDLTLVETEA